MSNQLSKINPMDLTGPRSYFTDLDTINPDYDESPVIRKLKLQMLTKNKVVIAASYLFHDIGYNLIKNDKGLVMALNQGIILPALRSEFDTISDFFYHKPNYSKSSQIFFSQNTKAVVPWDLYENTNWFKNIVFSSLSSSESVLLKKTGITLNDGLDIVSLLRQSIAADSETNNPFLKREHIASATSNYSPTVREFINNFSNLAYQLSGARVVNSEGHFPQSNLTNVSLIENDHFLTDDSIFWDIFVGAAINHLSSAIKISADRIDRLCFEDILKIRKGFFSQDFIGLYDNLIQQSKAPTDMNRPDSFILNAEKVADTATALRAAFSEQIRSEMSFIQTAQREDSLLQIANTLAPLATSIPFLGSVIGVVSVLKSIPQCTAPFSSEIARNISEKGNWVRTCINNKIGWSASQKTALLDAYRSLAVYGI